jgi:L-alanine-DL-glutamate epimerase-like enolase superfamily enzyme
MSMLIEGVTVHAEIERLPLKAPFRITGHVWEAIDVLVVSLEKDGCVGRGEAAGVYFKGDTPYAMLAQIESRRGRIEAGVSRASVQRILPPGGARNALDCAVWDLEAKLSHQPAWQMAGFEELRPLLTTFTCGAGSPEQMAAAARDYAQAKAIKLKLTGEQTDAPRVQAVRDARPDVWLGVDANQGFTRGGLERLMPTLLDARVELIEQPFPIDQDAWLDGLGSPIPVAADERAHSRADLPQLVGRFNVVNIKLDKCGGLTEGLAMARVARELGLAVMVGNMTGSSLAIAPAIVLGQLCEIVDLDGAIFLRQDRVPSVSYRDGHVWCDGQAWGGAGPLPA